ncbi:PREDICTED: testin-like [Dufourea novaeangliae]|uniref:testin-like n=1 Tax=Dufourea novaeangliae TaxID=178035 RepID=UPI0007675E83|nr:PREDICTED: testin-like [Dufourea novaeangliae]
MDDGESKYHPKWLLEIENRKRKPRLAHEAGAGAPCAICNATCPGLDLHFWRKTCKNCKCSKDDHDVDDEDFPQFDLLFGSSKKYKKKPMLLHVHSEKEHAEEAFEWIPPDTTKELATEYMKALPIDKLPIKGSAGAALRRQLLQKQLPLHDIDSKFCDELSEQEKNQFEKYLENIKKYVGQGTVTKILGARPFDRSLMTPANATDMQPYSPRNKPCIQSSMIHLRTPSSFTSNNSYKKDLHTKSNDHEPPTLPIAEILNNSRAASISEKCNTISSNCKIVKSEPIKEDKEIPTNDNLKYSNSAVIPFQNSLEYCEKVYKDTLENPPISLLHSESINDEARIAETILADALLPPSRVHAHDIIGSTLDEKDLMFIREKLTNKYSNQRTQLQIPHNATGFRKVFDTNELLQNNVESQNLNTDNESNRTAVIAATKNTSCVPTLSKGRIQTLERNVNEPTRIDAEKYLTNPNSQTFQSIPLDVTMSHSKSTRENPLSSVSLPQTCVQFANSDNHRTELGLTIPCTVIYSEKLQHKTFPSESIGGRNQPVESPLLNLRHLKGVVEELTMDPINLQKCYKCEETIRVGDVAVITVKAKNVMWHPGCFVCNICNELLVDLLHFYYKNKLYCGRDLSTLLGIPRCFACDELIFVREYTVAEGHNYHVKHFCCWDCDVPLAGKQYITENDRPLCLPCYQNTYAKTCHTCEKVIAADQQGVTVKDLNFHATGTCFCCYICKKDLLKSRTAIKETKLFCSKECIAKFLQPQK